MKASPSCSSASDSPAISRVLITGGAISMRRLYHHEASSATMAISTSVGASPSMPSHQTMGTPMSVPISAPITDSRAMSPMRRRPCSSAP